MGDQFVSAEKWRELDERLAALGVREGDLVERFTRGSGPGGQKINKTSSCVHLRHGPSGVVLKCQRSRSREVNRYMARRELCDRLDQRLRGAESARQEQMEKIRRQKRRRSRRQKQRMIEGKHRRSAAKRLRAPVVDDHG